jgi:hypothetical protein
MVNTLKLMDLIKRSNSNYCIIDSLNMFSLNRMYVERDLLKQIKHIEHKEFFMGVVVTLISVGVAELVCHLI